MNGFVEQISEKQRTGANGNYMTYNVKINGEWLGAGYKKPQCKQGDNIDYEITQKGQYKNITNISINSGAITTNAPNNATTAPTHRVDTRDISIRYQSCRKDALALTNMLLASDALKLPAKQADKVDAALAFVDEITNQYYIALQDVMDKGGVTVEDLIPQTDVA